VAYLVHLSLKIKTSGGETSLPGGGTAILGGGTPDTDGGTPFRPVPAEFNHCRE